jgi:hypothetical protein
VVISDISKDRQHLWLKKLGLKKLGLKKLHQGKSGKNKSRKVLFNNTFLARFTFQA